MNVPSKGLDETFVEKAASAWIEGRILGTKC